MEFIRIPHESSTFVTVEQTLAAVPYAQEKVIAVVGCECPSERVRIVRQLFEQDPALRVHVCDRDILVATADGPAIGHEIMETRPA